MKFKNLMKKITALVYCFILSIALLGCKDRHHRQSHSGQGSSLVMYEQSYYQRTQTITGYSSSIKPCNKLWNGLYDLHCQSINTPLSTVRELLSDPAPPSCHYVNRCNNLFKLFCPQPYWYCGTLPIPITTTSSSSSSSSSGGVVQCVRGGCNGELCGEVGSYLASPCVMRPGFACYKNATCSIQSNGRCGWTMDEQLTACLASSSSSSSSSSGSSSSSSSSSGGNNNCRGNRPSCVVRGEGTATAQCVNGQWQCQCSNGYDFVLTREVGCPNPCTANMTERQCQEAIRNYNCPSYGRCVPHSDPCRCPLGLPNCDSDTVLVRTPFNHNCQDGTTLECTKGVCLEKTLTNPLEDWQICSRDSDCVMVSDRCGCMSNGNRVGINSQYKDSWEQYLRDTSGFIACAFRARLDGSCSAEAVVRCTPLQGSNRSTCQVVY